MKLSATFKPHGLGYRGSHGTPDEYPFHTLVYANQISTR